MDWMLLLKTMGITLAAIDIAIITWLIYGYLAERRQPKKCR